MKAEIAVELPGSNTVVPHFKERAPDRGGPPLHSGWLPVLGRIPLFASLTKRHLRRLASLAEMKRFKAGTDVVRAGTQGNAFFVILDGRAEVTTPAGHTRMLKEGDYFGELALLDGAPRAATVTATNSLATARIPRSAFLRLLKEEPEMWAGLTHGLLAIVRELQKVPLS
jgi:CRP/FNR family transcriptional regulator, cyclic AMP receptor protein